MEIARQNGKLRRQAAKRARQMHEETDADGRRLHTVAQIAAEFGVPPRQAGRHR